VKFPIDAPRQRVLVVLGKLGFTIVREGNHIALERKNARRHGNTDDNSEPWDGEGLHASNDLSSSRHQPRRLPASMGGLIAGDRHVAQTWCWAW
jgi:hypothetical protein